MIVSIVQNKEQTWDACFEGNMILFEWTDVNCDGVMQKEEYFAWQKALGTTEADAEVGWKDLDPDDHGEITRHRFTTFATDFFFSQDADHGQAKNFYGKLPDDH